MRRPCRYGSFSAGKRDRVPDHSWLSRTRARLPHEVERRSSRRVWSRAKMPRPWRPTRRCATSCGGTRARVTGGCARLAESGIETPTAEDLARLDRKRKGKKLEPGWVSKSDPEAKIAKMKDGTTHLAYARARGGSGHRRGGGRSTGRGLYDAGEDAGGGQGESRGGGRGTDGRRPECVTDKGYHSRSVGARRRPLEDADLRAQAERFCALAARGGPPGSHQQGPSCYRALLAPRSFLCAQPRSRRHAPDMAARARERAQAIPAPCRRPQSESPDAQTDRRRHPAGGRGGRIWLYLRAYCASWSRSGR